MIVGFASFIITIGLAWAIVSGFSNAVKGKSEVPEVFHDIGKIGITALAVKEAYDIITNNNKRGVGSGTTYNVNTSDDNINTYPFAQHP